VDWKALMSPVTTNDWVFVIDQVKQTWHPRSNRTKLTDHSKSAPTASLYTIEGLRDKKRICSITMKLKKSLVKPVTQQNTSSCLVLPPEIVMQDASNVILWTSADICVVHDNLSWKNWTTCYNCRFSATSLALRVIFSGGTTKQHVIIGFGELAAVN